MTRQPTFFPAPPFLEKKLGASVFTEIPQKPGIYRFYDQNGELLYVGKSINLRKRLFSYKRKRAGTASKKESRLIGLIDAIEYEVMETEQDAILAENRCIRSRRPPFNHANKQTEAYYFIRMFRSKTHIRFSLTMNASLVRDASLDKTPLFSRQNGNETASTQPDDTGRTSSLYGCFKGHLPVRKSFGALLRLLWYSVHRPASPQYLPSALTRNLAPLNFTISLQPLPVCREDLYGSLDDWFLGKSRRLIGFLQENLPPVEHPFLNCFYRNHLDILRSFYERTLVRHNRVRQVFFQEERFIIPQDQLDDLMAKYPDSGS